MHVTGISVETTDMTVGITLQSFPLFLHRYLAVWTWAQASA